MNILDNGDLCTLNTANLSNLLTHFGITEKLTGEGLRITV